MSFDQYNALAERIVRRFETLSFDRNDDLISSVARMVSDFMNPLTTATILEVCDDLKCERYTEAVGIALAYRDEFGENMAQLLVCMEEAGLLDDTKVTVIKEAIGNFRDLLELLLPWHDEEEEEAIVHRMN